MEIIEKYGGIAFNHREVDYQDKILAATNGNGVNVILEMLSNVNLGMYIERKHYCDYSFYLSK